MIESLVQIALLLVIIWLVVNIRASLGQPSMVTRMRRSVGQTTERMITSRTKSPTDDNVVDLATIDPDVALDAVAKYYESGKK